MLFLRKVRAEVCGVTVILEWRQNGCAGGRGSTLNTSSVAPAKWPSFSSQLADEFTERLQRTYMAQVQTLYVRRGMPTVLRVCVGSSPKRSW
jgi:hypothetical protein